MTDILSPVAGRVVPLADAPDPVFAAEMVGSGVGIVPADDATEAIAPISGKVMKVHPHAYVIMGEGVGILVHLGLDTVKLNGEGFTVHVENKATVEAGTPMITWDPVAVAELGLSNMVLVCAMDTAPGSVTSPVVGSDVARGDVLFSR